MENRLLEHHITETRENFKQVHQNIGDMRGKLDDLTKFKIEMVVSARFTSVIVSAVLGLITMVISAWVSSEISSRAQAAREVSNAQSQGKNR